MGDTSFFGDHFFGEFGEGAAPTAPTLSISISGTTATGTINGDDGATNHLFYMVSGDSSWTSAGERAGDGTIAAAGLSTGVRYTFVAVSVSAAGISLPSTAADVLIGVTTTATIDILLAGHADIFLAHFGESATYYPTGGGSRDILAVIERGQPQSIPGVDKGNMIPADVIVKNDPDDGISSAELNKGSDLLAYPVRIGESANQKRIMKILWQDIGMIGLKVA